MIYQVDVNKSGTFWQLNGNLHREDGPAIECVNGTKEWWLNDKQYTEEEFNCVTKKVIPEYTMEEAIKLIGHEFKINIKNPKP